MSDDKQVIVEDNYHDKISKISFSNKKILIEIWDSDKGLVYIWIKESKDVLKLKRFFESAEMEENET